VTIQHHFWNSATLAEVAQISSGSTPTRTIESYWNGNIPWVTTSLIDFNIIDTADEYITEEGLRNSAVKIFPAGTILMALYGQGVTRGKVAMLGIDAAINQACASIIPGPKVTPWFLFYYLQHQYEAIRNLSHGGHQQNLSGQLIKKIAIPLMSIYEQDYIVRILSIWDRAIIHITDLITAKRERRSLMSQQLLTAAYRFPKFTHNWTKRTLGDLIIPVRRLTPKPSGPYKALGIRSHCKGTFEKVVNEPSTVAMTELFTVQKGDLIVNITFAWEGAIAFVPIEHDGYHVSHRFPTYQLVEDKVIPDFLRYVVTQPQFVFTLGLISPGGAGRNRVLNKRDFLEIVIPVPCLEEQRKIGTLLKLVDCEIDLLSQRLNAFREQKKGLMQQLLAGKRRVRVAETEATVEIVP